MASDTCALGCVANDCVANDSSDSSEDSSVSNQPRVKPICVSVLFVLMSSRMLPLDVMVRTRFSVRGPVSPGCIGGVLV